MTTKRVKPGVAALGGKIYAVGGSDTGGRALSTVETFDPQNNSWAAVAPMSTARRQCSVAVVSGKLHAVSGATSDGCVASVEAYDPQLGRWEAVAPLHERRCLAAAICV